MRPAEYMGQTAWEMDMGGGSSQGCAVLGTLEGNQGQAWCCARRGGTWAVRWACYSDRPKARMHWRDVSVRACVL